MTEVEEMLIEKLADHLIWICSREQYSPEQQARAALVMILDALDRLPQPKDMEIAEEIARELNVAINNLWAYKPDDPPPTPKPKHRIVKP